MKEQKNRLNQLYEKVLKVEDCFDLQEHIQELQEIIELQDPDMIEHINVRIDELEQMYQEKILRGPYDKNNAYLSLYSGAGGDDAADWTRMLLRMYQRYAEQKQCVCFLTACSYNEKGGIREATLSIQSPYAFGFFKDESGVHRLVRLSPFSSAQLRHTSFAFVDVIPEINNTTSVIVPDKDIKMDFLRSSGPGGQNVNKRDTAVRLTHIPTGVSALSQSERSQSANREQAHTILISKLNMIKVKQNKERIEDLKNNASVVQWGSQIRSYVLHPYQMVKDHRTGVQTSQVEKVLDGDLDMFIQK